MFAYGDKRPDVRAFTDLRGGCDGGGGVDPRCGTRRLIEELQRACVIVIRIFRNQRGYAIDGLCNSTALAFVSFSFGAYLEFERKVRCPEPACSSPRTPVISRFAASSGRHCREQPSAAANSLIFMVKHKGTPGAGYSCGGGCCSPRGRQTARSASRAHPRCRDGSENHASAAEALSFYRAGFGSSAGLK